MTHSQIKLGSTLVFYGWLPICFLIFIYTMYRVCKKVSQKKIVKEGTIANTYSIIAIAFWYSIPALILFIVMTVPIFYFNYLTKQENYCLDVIRINKITTADHKFLQERCDSFDIDELIDRVYR